MSRNDVNHLATYLNGSSFHRTSQEDTGESAQLRAELAELRRRCPANADHWDIIGISLVYSSLIIQCRL